MFTHFLAHPERRLFDEFERLQRDFDSLLGTAPSIRGSRRGAFPAIDIDAGPQEIRVRVMAPGLVKDDFDISIQQNVLSIAGRRAAPPRDEASGWCLRERFTGEFRRVLSLPEDVDPERVEAGFQDGVLELRIKRRGASSPRQISIN